LKKGIWRVEAIRLIENAPILDRLLDSSARIAIEIILALAIHTVFKPLVQDLLD
jgi:hypothetical protein